jgi:large subunit ribosomal protein L17
MFRNMVTSLFKHDRITTTDAKAKELRRWADHVVTLAKRGDLHARRLAMSIVREKDVVHKIFEVAPERFGSMSGGYTRIVKIGRRPGDAAPVTVVELLSGDTVKPASPKKAKPVVDVIPPPAVEESAPAPTSEETEDKPVEAQAAEADAEDTPEPKDPPSPSESTDTEE